MTVIVIDNTREGDFHLVVKEIKPKIIFFCDPKEERLKEYTNYYFPYHGSLIFHSNRKTTQQMVKALKEIGEVTIAYGECKEIDDIEGTF